MYIYFKKYLMAWRFDLSRVFLEGYLFPYFMKTERKHFFLKEQPINKAI